MKKQGVVYSSFLLLFALFFNACQSEPAEAPKPMFALAPNDDGLTLPDQFDAVVVVDTLGRGRHLVVRENGDIYVHLRNKTDEGHSLVALRDTSGDGKADKIETFGGYPGTGIEIHKNYLYFATPGRIYRTMLGNSLVPTGAIDTIALLEGGEGGHSEKEFTFDSQGNMYVNVGSLSNACEEPLRTAASRGPDPCIELDKRAGIWKFNDSQPMQQQTKEMRYATGIRNAVAINWDPSSNSLYAVSHGRDDLHRYWEDIFTEEENVELPAEEFFQVSEGDNFGWPYCFYNQIEKKKLLNPEYGGDGKTVGRCEDAKLPLIGFPGHWGPNDIIFYQGNMFPEKYKHGAFIAFHGSWNRLGHDQAGFKVVFVPMKDGQVTG
ncbi:MAG: PQQ-dependent sugar dehydrogenase, partial [Saprospiraceae bacterium]|nr:PQQ-dependent sugar dehydrogenase [Saprospiraceae bacterium]